ncbi:aldo/keto reductase [Pelagibius sp. Alg239-R121]|uniref:aldo/keto reductase n=1 Tax=Pelagibius sp. Alg239-R121 TaxID=2993448 RepID=UPI0024A63C5E|nr:aldo/keto reductase [Pelagibius sp. Alg239-R121]
MHRVSANGAKIPAIGLGTWTLRDEAASELVESAIKSGYRHIDTAAMYENEEAVGAGLRASGLARDEIFLTSKIWYTDIAEGDLQRSVEASLKRLGTDYLDLALIHWPSKSVALADSIGALNEVHTRGLTRNIGVSNFTSTLIEEAVALSTHPLACNQVEYHPFLNQDTVKSACNRHGMAMVSYCPLARGSDLFGLPEVADPAQSHGKTPAQIVLRWHVQQEGVIAIPRSSNAERIRQNFEVFDFALSDDEMAAISALRERNHRICDFDFSPDWD